MSLCRSWTPAMRSMSVQRQLEAALEAQKLAHAEVQSRTSHIEQAQVNTRKHACSAIAF